MRREFVMIIRGIVNDFDNSDLSEENLRLNLESISQAAQEGGVIDGSTAEIEKFDHTITISDMR